ncbi:MAG: hypothetical protein AB7P40_00180 [Chloroflexota bacterium]
MAEQLKLRALIPDLDQGVPRSIHIVDMDGWQSHAAEVTGGRLSTEALIERAHVLAAAPEMKTLLESLHEDLCRYAKLTEGVWSSGSIAFDSMATDICRVLAKARGETSDG